MISFGRRCALALVLAKSVSAQAAVPKALDLAVARRVAESWRVPAERVVLEWSLVPGTVLGTDSVFQLLGRGVDGWFVAVLPAPRAPVAIRFRAGVQDSVAVAARAILAGSRIRGTDVKRELRTHWGPKVTALEEMEGWEVRFGLREGDLLRPPAVMPPQVIQTGDIVRFRWGKDNVGIEVVGIALHPARRGETVRARIEGREGEVRGVVEGPGTARLVNRSET